MLNGQKGRYIMHFGTDLAQKPNPHPPIGSQGLDKVAENIQCFSPHLMPS